ncbi:MAG: phosphoenolpyruvate--protein phosphotransferase [Pseudohongiella sp.]|nr:phosphoenolpyruvate--protein phosphotransferase [Pseudohongiella sp.]
MKKAIMELTRIVQAVSMLDTPHDQVTYIVDSISAILKVGACSLYRVDSNFEAELLASHGLVSKEQIKLPAGVGLVGLVAKSRHPVNVADAASHPNFYLLDNSNEEKFKSFCGVPLVRSGKVIGVLVVQSKFQRQLSQEREGFLVTLAFQLAMIVANIPSLSTQPSVWDKHSSGIVGSQGIGIGNSLLCMGAQLKDVPDAECEDTEAEIQSWQDLLIRTQAEISSEREALGSQIPESVAHIFDAYSMLLSDQSLINKVKEEILLGHWLPGALRLSINFYCEIFKAMDDPYLRARHEDVQHLGNKLFKTWIGNDESSANLAANYAAVVLVGAQVSVSDIAMIPAQKLAGIVCFEGSSLSHTAVLANALGIPAVMGVGEPKGLHSGDLIIVDGYNGEIILHPSKLVVREYRQLLKKNKLHLQQLESLRDKPAISIDHVSICLMVNTGLLADISPGVKSGAEGVGLYRTEIPFMVRDSFPNENEQVEVYEQVFAAYAGKPVYMRTLDIGGDKQLPYFPIHHEENPALGWRGIRLTLDTIQLLITQVRAMIRASGNGKNLSIVLPMICSITEVDAFNELLDDVCEQLQSDGFEFHRPQVGIMVEVPAVISQIPFLSNKVDFLSIGSNDLSQYLLAVDRNNARVANRFDHVHPAVLHEINRTICSAKSAGLGLSLCGEMASDPVAVVILLGMGLRQLSMSAAMLPSIKSLIRLLRISRAESLCEQALRLDNVSAIRQLINIELREIGYLNKPLPAI